MENRGENHQTTDRLQERVKKILASHSTIHKVEDFVYDYLTKNPTSTQTTKESVKEAIQSSGLIDGLISNISSSISDPVVPQRKSSLKKTVTTKPVVSISSNSSSVSPLSSSSSSDYSIALTIISGSAFFAYLPPDDDKPSPNNSKYLIISVTFASRTYSSKPVSACSEPSWSQLLYLPTFSSSLPSLTKPRYDPKMYFSVIEQDPTTGSKKLIGSQTFDSRSLLETGSCNMSLELGGIGSEHNIPIGLLHLRASFDPILEPKTRHHFSAQQIAEALASETRAQLEADRKFFSYASKWWNEYCDIRPGHEDRLVKIFALSESGLNKWIGSYIHPQSSRLISTPTHAARFVSLIPHQRVFSLAATRSEIWTSIHCFLATGSGDIEDHALLLTSLFLGFQLNAFLVIGTYSSTSTVGVLVLDEQEEGRLNQSYFWAPLSGKKWPLSSSSVPLTTIDCLANDTSFYANIQPPSLTLPSLDLNLTNSSAWKSMSKSVLESVKHHQTPFPHLRPPSSSIHEIESLLESQLRERISSFRSKTLSTSTTQWNRQLEPVLAPALVAYETERTIGVSFGNTEFQHSIKRAVEEGYSFKGFPISFSHTNTDKIFDALQSSAISSDILSTTGDSVRFSVRVKVFSYPEDIQSVWVMIAVSYKQLNNY